MPAMDRSRALRHLIQKSDDALDPAITHHREVRALDRAVDAFGTEPPGEAQIVAVTVRLAEQREAEFREALLHASDHRINAVVTVSAHQRIDVARVAGPVRRQNGTAAVRGLFVPQVDVAGGDGFGFGHDVSPSNVPNE